MKSYHFRIKLHNYTVVKVPMMQNALTDLLGIEHPIIQAPMASAATPEILPLSPLHYDAFPSVL